MDNFHEKIFFGLTVLASAVFSFFGTILTAGETRWLFMTALTSLLTSGFLALMFKKVDDTIQYVVGRCGIAILGGIFGTQPAVHYLGITNVETNIITLGGVSAAACAATFILGYCFLKLLESRAPGFAERILKKYVPETLQPDEAKGQQQPPQPLQPAVPHPDVLPSNALPPPGPGRDVGV